MSDDKRASMVNLIYERLTERLVKELIAFAIKRSKELRWRTGSSLELPGGETPQSIVSLAIVRAVEGTRQWDPDTHPDLGWYLKGVIRSLLNHLATSRENTLFKAVPDSEEPESSLRYADTDATEFNGAEWLARVPATPEEDLFAKKRLNEEEWAADILDQAASEDTEVSVIIRAIRNGCDPRSDMEIADQTGLAIEAVRKAKKRLNRLIDRIATQVRETTGNQTVARRTTHE